LEPEWLRSRAEAKAQKKVPLEGIDSPTEPPKGSRDIQRNRDRCAPCGHPSVSVRLLQTYSKHCVATKSLMDVRLHANLSNAKQRWAGGYRHLLRNCDPNRSMRWFDFTAK